MGWSLQKLADVAGVDRSMIGKVEKGERGLSSLEAVSRLARALAVPIDALSEYLDGEISTDQLLSSAQPKAPGPSAPFAAGRAPHVQAFRRMLAELVEDGDGAAAVYGLRWLAERACREVDPEEVLRRAGFRETVIEERIAMALIAADAVPMVGDEQGVFAALLDALGATTTLGVADFGRKLAATPKRGPLLRELLAVERPAVVSIAGFMRQNIEHGARRRRMAFRAADVIGTMRSSISANWGVDASPFHRFAMERLTLWLLDELLTVSPGHREFAEFLGTVHVDANEEVRARPWITELMKQLEATSPAAAEPPTDDS